MATVAVTGASGYIGSHVVSALLSRGHMVRGTVRDPTDRKKTAHLQALPGAERLSLHAADLSAPESFAGVFAGCDWVAHTAAPATRTAKDHERDIIAPALSGMRGALEAAAGADVKRVVVTSSASASRPDDGQFERPYTEEDWNERATIAKSPYPYAKTLSEKMAWEMNAALPEERRYRLVTLLPVMVAGPLLTAEHARTSPTLFYSLLTGEVPACPRLHFPLVDVRDVALAHVLALESEHASGRYLLSNPGWWVRDMAAKLREHFPAYPIPRRDLPDVFMYLRTLWDRRMSWAFLSASLGVARECDNRRSREHLGLTYRPTEETIVDTCRSLIAVGAVAAR